VTASYLASMPDMESPIVSGVIAVDGGRIAIVEAYACLKSG
jgi:hypothetical protein